MSRFLPITGSYVLALVFTPSAGVAGDWPRFRGPNGAGIADAGTPLTDIVPAWKVPIPGRGHSSPVVVGGRVFLQSSTDNGSARSLLCLDARNGGVLWAREVLGNQGHIHQKNSLASSTPAVEGDRVFALFWDGAGCRLHAYDLDGKPLWDADLGPFTSDHGAGLSPMAFADKVFVNYDQGGQREVGAKADVLAFDAATGTRLWSASRRGYRACSATPIVRELAGGGAELVVSSTAGVTAYDPDTGSVNWDWPWRFSGMPLRTIAGPLLVNGTVVAFAGDGGGARSAVAVTPGANPRLVWEKRKATPYVPTPVALGKHLYWVTDDGQAVCADAATGEPVWDERAFNRPVSASLLLAGDRVLAVAENGKAVTFRASPTGFELLAETDLGEAVFATPAGSAGRLFVRGSDHLFCFTGK